MNFNIHGIKIIALDNTKYSSNTRISIPVNHLRKGANVIHPKTPKPRQIENLFSCVDHY